MQLLKPLYRRFLPLRLLYEYFFFCIDRVFGYAAEKKGFYRARGYYPNLKNPVTFSEKILWKKINDRNPLLPLTSDKYLVRSYLEETLGQKKAAALLVPLLHVTDKPETIPFDRLPQSYIVKANHGSGRNLIVENDNKSRAEILAHCRLWLSTPYGLRQNEWAYLKIRRLIVVEELLKDQEGNPPLDIKFFMFHGHCGYIRVSTDGSRTFSCYDREWSFLPLVKDEKKQGPVLARPANLDAMLSLANEISQPFDFVRVDLYTSREKIYFGELTHYPRSGRVGIPHWFDLELGSLWRLPDKR